MDITAHPPLNVSEISTPDLEALIAVYEKYRPGAGELVVSGEIAVTASVPG